MKTTLNLIRLQHPCGIEPDSDGTLRGLLKLMKHLGKTEADDEPVSILQILESNGMADALWCLCAVIGRDKEKRLLAVEFARMVEHLSSDPRVKACNDVNERFAHGLATKEELRTARKAAYADAEAFAAFADADAAASAAAYAAASAAAYASRNAASYAAAAYAADAAAGAYAACAAAAAYAAYAAYADDAAVDTVDIRAKQEATLRKMCTECEKEEQHGPK